MPGLEDLASGQYYTGEDPFARARPLSMGVPFTPLGPPETSAKLVPAKKIGALRVPRGEDGRFKKADLGDFEKLDVRRAYAPSEKISDLVPSFLYGIGDQYMSLAALPRRMADLAGVETNLPSRKEIGKMMTPYQRFVPLEPGTMKAVAEGPKTPWGDTAATVGNFAAFGPFGLLGALGRKALPWLISSESIVP